MRKLWAKITRKGSEAGEYPIQQATYLGRVSDSFVLFPYGMHANLPVDQLGLLIDRQGRIFMGTSAIGRITVEEGEVVFYHPQTRAKMHFKASGDIDIDTQNPEAEEAVHGSINILTKNITITTSEKTIINSTGDIDVTTSGTVNVESTGDTNLTAPTVAVDGDLTVTGDIVATGEVTGNGIDLSTHTHPYTWTDPAGSGNTSPPT